MLRVTVLSGLGHAIAVVVALLVYTVVTRAGHQRRHPASAIGWVLGMVTFPYLFLPLFLVFGPRKAVRPQDHPRLKGIGRQREMRATPALSSSGPSRPVSHSAHILKSAARLHSG